MMRSLAVSFFTSAWWMTNTEVAIGFFKNWYQNEAVFGFVAALGSMAPEMSARSGLHNLDVIVFTLNALGVGLVAGSIYAWMERTLFELPRSFLSSIKSFHASRMQKHGPVA